VNLASSCKVKLPFITKCNVTTYQIALTVLPDKKVGGIPMGNFYGLKIIIKFEVWEHRKKIL